VKEAIDSHKGSESEMTGRRNLDGSAAAWIVVATLSVQALPHGGQQLAFWNGHHDERGFAPMPIYHLSSGTPVVTILRPARTPKGTEARTVIKHVSKRLRRHSARII
jgi:hypothetical protein